MILRGSLRGELFAVLAAALFILMPTAAVAAEYVVQPGDGVTFYQVDQTFPGFAESDSQWCRVNVDIAQLAASSGIPLGFLNVWQAGYGWSPQNLLVDAGAGAHSIGTYFGLPVTPGTDVSAMSAYVVLSSEPKIAFSSGSPQTFAVGAMGYNAEGKGYAGTTSGLGTPASPGSVAFEDAFWELFWTFVVPNVEAAPMQCGPAAAANSLQMLEHKYPWVNIPHDNEPGVRGNPSSSLVGQLDLHMNRAAGSGVSDTAMVRGKAGYIAANELADDLYVKYMGSNVPATITTGGVTAASQGTSPTVAWLRQELEAGEDVEFGWSRPGGGGHWVKLEGIATVGGKTKLMYSHDASQGVDGGLEFDELTVGDTDGDGMLEVIAGDRPGSNIDIAVSESPFYKNPPYRTPATAWWSLTVASVVALGLPRWLRRRAPRTPPPASS